jgi:hypothetical protein
MRVSGHEDVGLLVVIMMTRMREKGGIMLSKNFKKK